MPRPDFTGVRAFHGMISRAPGMADLFDRVARLAASDVTVLIRGESGTGKELVARALHAGSPRRHRPFRAVNCATLTDELAASELFGHVRGAFTGAVSDHRGLFAQADGGTVFLDEVAELSPSMQARLLRVLQERSFVPLGGSRAVRADVRVVSATNRGLREAVAAGRFREDLMYRVRVAVLFLPPLRERPGDVELLTWHFIERFNRRGGRRITDLADDARDALLAHDWPGNVRELRNNVEAAFAVGEGPVLRLDELAPELRGEGPPDRREEPPGPGPRWADLERRRLWEALEAAGGRRGEAARALGISRSTLWRRMKKHGLA